MIVAARLVVPLLLALACLPALAAATLDQELAALARESDAAKFDTPEGDLRVKAFEAVQQHAANVTRQYPNRAEPLAWEAWALIDQSVVLRSLSSLGLLKQARKKLEVALTIDPNNADANSTLGSLYFNVPRWPLSFGDRKKGRVYLQKSLALDPSSGWKNLDYAKCLVKDEDYSGAMKYAALSLQSPLRPNSKRDANIKAEAEELMVKAKEKLR